MDIHSEYDLDRSRATKIREDKWRKNTKYITFLTLG